MSLDLKTSLQNVVTPGRYRRPDGASYGPKEITVIEVEPDGSSDRLVHFRDTGNPGTPYMELYSSFARYWVRIDPVPVLTSTPKPTTPSDRVAALIETLRHATGEELAEIRRLLGVPIFEPAPPRDPRNPYRVEIVPLSHDSQG